MARPRRDGSPHRQPARRRLTWEFVKNVQREARPFNITDDIQPALKLRVFPSGTRTYYAFYRFPKKGGRPRWLEIGNALKFGREGLEKARVEAARIIVKAAEGVDAAAERKAQRSRGTF